MNLLLRLFGLESGADVHRIIEAAWQASRPLAPAALIAVVGLGLALAVVNLLPQVAMRTSVRVGTFVLRVALVLLLLVIVCGLEWHVGLELNQKQNWTVLVDDSASMAAHDVEGQSRFAAARADLEKIRATIDGRVNLAVQSFSGKPLGDEPGVGPTLIRDAVARAALSRQHPDRLILLTDGRDSQARRLAPVGEDLKAHNVKLDVRLYGSKTPLADTGIVAEPQRNVIRLGEELVVRGSLTGAARNEAASLTFKEDGKPLQTVEIQPNAGGRFELRHKPKKEGQHVYTLELPAGDPVSQNNAVRFTAHVVKEKINVLLIEGYPRFEFKLMKGVLEVDPLVNLVTLSHIPGGGVYVQGEPLHRNPELGLIASQAELFKYDVVILRDVARSYFRTGGDTGESTLRNLVEFVTKRGGGMMVCGGQDVYRAGGYENSHLAEILPFDLSDQIGGQPQFDGLFFANVPKPALAHPILQLLSDPAENRERLAALRQLDGSNNVGRFKPLATPLLTRTVELTASGGKTAEKESPIMGYMAVGEGKVLGVAVDTLWRWQLQSELDDPPLAMLMANAVRYLAPPPGRKAGEPNVALSDGTPQVGQDLLLTTELRDSNFDPVSAADLVVSVTRPDQNTYRIYPRDLPEEPGVYSYRVALDVPGPYRVTAKYGKQESTREFLAGAAAGEFVDLSVDRDGVNDLAQAAGGELAGGELDAWLAALDVEPAQVAAVRDLEVWNSPLVLVAFILLVSADCYIRKRAGLA